MALNLTDILCLASFVMLFLLFCYVNCTTASPNLEHDPAQLQHETRADKTTGGTAACFANVYVLTSRTAQSALPFSLGKLRLSYKIPAFTTHWAVRVRWANGDDKVWQIFQADKMVLSPKCSDHDRVRKYFDCCHHVGLTYHSMHEISQIALAARNDKRIYHLVTSNCQTFVLEVLKRIVDDSGLDNTPPFDNTVMMGFADSRRPVAFGSFLLMLVHWGMFPLALAFFRALFSGTDILESHMVCDCFIVLSVCVAKLLRTDPRFIKRRSTFGPFVFENRTLMSYVDIYGSFRSWLMVFEFSIELFTSGSTHLMLRNTVRTVVHVLWIQTGFILQMLSCAEFPAMVKNTIQPSGVTSSLPVELKNSFTSPSGHRNDNAVQSTKHDQHQKHQTLPRPTDQADKHVTNEVARRRRLLDVEQHDASLIVRRRPRRRHRVIVLDIERESHGMEP